MYSMRRGICKKLFVPKQGSILDKERWKPILYHPWARWRGTLCLVNTDHRTQFPSPPPTTMSNPSLHRRTLNVPLHALEQRLRREPTPRLHPPQEVDTRSCFLSPSFPRNFVHLLHRGQLGHLQLHPRYKFFMKELVASCTKQCRSSCQEMRLKWKNTIITRIIAWSSWICIWRTKNRVPMFVILDNKFFKEEVQTAD
jgi:hypothetical protein